MCADGKLGSGIQHWKTEVFIVIRIDTTRSLIGLSTLCRHNFGHNGEAKESSAMLE